MKDKPVELRCYWADWQLTYVAENNTYCEWRQNLITYHGPRIGGPPVVVGKLLKVIVREENVHALPRGTHWTFTFAGEQGSKVYSTRPGAVRRLRGYNR